MLQKSAEYILQLRTERDQLKDEMDTLRQQIESLDSSIRYVNTFSKEKVNKHCSLLRMFFLSRALRYNYSMTYFVSNTLLFKTNVS